MAGAGLRLAPCCRRRRSHTRTEALASTGDAPSAPGHGKALCSREPPSQPPLPSTPLLQTCPPSLLLPWPYPQQAWGGAPDAWLSLACGLPRGFERVWLPPGAQHPASSPGPPCVP